MLESLTKRKISIGVLSLVLCFAALIVFKQHKEVILKGIQDFAIKMRSTKHSWVLVTLLIIICSVPPIFGFTFIVTMSGFIYGFPNGCFPATLGTFIGCLTCFGLVRVFKISKWIKLSDKNQEKYQAIKDAVNQGGFKMLLLIRICPIPWQVTNLMLSLIDKINWKSYAAAAFIASFKVNLEVWVGAQLANLSDPNLPPEAHRVAMISMIVGLVMLTIVAVWIYMVTMRKVKQKHIEQVLIDEENNEEQTVGLLNGAAIIGTSCYLDDDTSGFGKNTNSSSSQTIALLIDDNNAPKKSLLL